MFAFMKGIREVLDKIQQELGSASDEDFYVETRSNASALRRERLHLMNIIHLCKQGRIELTRQKNEMPVRKRKLKNDEPK